MFVCVRACVRLRTYLCLRVSEDALTRVRLGEAHRCGARDRAAPLERDGPILHVHCAASITLRTPPRPPRADPRHAARAHCACAGDRRAVEHERALRHGHRPSVPCLHTRGRRCDRCPAKPGMARTRCGPHRMRSTDRVSAHGHAHPSHVRVDVSAPTGEQPNARERTRRSESMRSNNGHAAH
jgi:hypothetical protein